MRRPQIGATASQECARVDSAITRWYKSASPLDKECPTSQPSGTLPTIRPASLHDSWSCSTLSIPRTPRYEKTAPYLEERAQEKEISVEISTLPCSKWFLRQAAPTFVLFFSVS